MKQWHEFAPLTGLTSMGTSSMADPNVFLFVNIILTIRSKEKILHQLQPNTADTDHSDFGHIYTY
jgi:hypothetical protein